MKCCTIPGCSKRHEARGWCKAHYKRWERHGDPLAGGTPHGEAARFLAEVVLTFQRDECLFWPYARNGAGYGEISAGDGRVTYIHRVACEAEHGAAPEGYLARHKCGNGHLGCVARRHLEWGTMTQNQIDRVAHGTHIRGERHPNHKLSSADVAAIRAIGSTRTQSSIALEFGIARATVGDILSRRRRAAEA